nr:lysine-sensitive aspartokinase 3 [Saprospiraceae bacterium]
MRKLIKVAKFGGTSMADIPSMRRCAKIVADDPHKKIVIVSATAGTTNVLTQLCTALPEVEKRTLLDQIKERHTGLCAELKDAGDVLPKISELIDDLEQSVHNLVPGSMADRDYILSFGERLSSTVFAEVLNEFTGDVTWLDVREVILTDDFFGSAEPQISEIAMRAQKDLMPLIESGRVVSQGFIGSTIDGKTTTLGRGGSDYSAALFAEAVGADVLEIWTDVRGIYSTDPRIVKDARPIPEMTFNEAAELAIFGAKVLHPATLKSVIRKNIKVYVASSMELEKPGTWIVEKTDEFPVIRAISLRRNQTLLTVHSLDMLHRFGFLARLFEVLSNHKISVDLVTTSEVNVSLTLDTGVQSDNQHRLTPEVLAELGSFSRVKVEKNLALIALIGNNLHATSGISGRVFGQLENVNVRMICHGASSHNLCFLVEEDSVEEAVKVLHKKFISGRN